jgi:DNA-binding beta-propeller fold protein YncE
VLKRSRLAVLLIAAFALGICSAAAARTASAPTLRYEYVVNGNEVYVYNLGNLAAPPVTSFSLPFSGPPQGVAFNAASATLYVSYGGEGGPDGTGSIIAYDLLDSRVVWQRRMPTGVDSIALTPNGQTIYVPAGEASGQRTWLVVSAATGSVSGRVAGGVGAHDTCVGDDGRYAYLGAVHTPYLEVASTATGKIVRLIGPLHAPGVRPFAIDPSQTYAFTTARSFLGFQVSSIATGKLLYNVAPPGFSFNPQTFPHTPDHGIAVTPDGKRLYLIDIPNREVHVFDLTGLPGSAPRDIANIPLAHSPTDDSWLEPTLDGRYVLVGSSGDVISTSSERIVGFLPELSATTEFIEVDWRNGRPVAGGARCS